MKLFFVGLCLYSLLIIPFYLLAINTGLPGRRGGPQDAFRHTIASAFTTRYLSPRIVKFVTFICETNSVSAFDLMDIHNNNIGINLGNSEMPIYESALELIEQGSINSHREDQLTWLEPQYWSNSY